MYINTPTLIMIVSTVIVTGFMLLPTKLKFGTPLIRFYWRGFWVFLSLISFIAFGSAAFKVAGYANDIYSVALLEGLVVAFVVFVMFAWFRLAGQAASNGFKWFVKRPHKSENYSKAD